MKIRKGDTVVVIAGNDKGTTGEVLEAFPSQQRVVVAGVNLRWKHNKPSQQNPQGERVQREFPIHVSNVMHLDPKTNERTRKSPERKKKAAKES